MNKYQMSLAVMAGLALLPWAALAQQDVTAAPQTPARQTERPIPVIGGEDFNPNQPIKPDFVISVSVVGEPDPSGQYQVDEAGNVSIRYAGIMTPVMVKGLTPAQAEDAIKVFLKTYVKNPQVKVSIIRVPRPVVFVSGGVKNPGPIQITQDTTLVDVLSRAEWTDNADLTQVRITRTETVDKEPKSVSKVINFENYIKIKPGAAPDENDNPILKDKDRILVGLKSLPGSGVVSVLGEVVKPAQNITLRNTPPMTVRELVNLVGGTTPAANRRSISIRRPGFDRPFIVDLDKAEQGDLVNNIELKPDDSVYVERLENNSYININGGFIKPGKFVYDKRTTLTQAVMEAGGVAPFAKTKEGVILRLETDSERQAAGHRASARRFHLDRIGSAAKTGT
jgi:protein involved in polysaccharide export with SLBB domain